MKFLIAASFLCLALVGQIQGGSLRGYTYSVPVPHQVYGVPNEVGTEGSRPIVEDVQRISFEKPILPQPEEEYDLPIVVAEYNPHVDSLPFVESVVNFGIPSSVAPSVPVSTTAQPELPRLQPGLPVLPERPVVPLVVEERIYEVNNAYLPPVREHSDTPVTEGSIQSEVHGTSAKGIESTVTQTTTARQPSAATEDPEVQIDEIPALPEAPVTPSAPDASSEVFEVPQVPEFPSVPAAVIPKPTSVYFPAPTAKEVPTVPQIAEIPTLPAAPAVPSVPVASSDVQVHDFSQYPALSATPLIPETHSILGQPSYGYVLSSVPQYAGIQTFPAAAPCDFYGFPQIQGFQSFQAAAIPDFSSVFGSSIPQYAGISAFPLISSLPTDPNEAYEVPSLSGAVLPGSGSVAVAPTLAKEIQITKIPDLPTAPVTPAPQPSGTYLPPPATHVHEISETPVTKITVQEINTGHGQHSTANEHLSLLQISEIPALPAAPVTPSTPVQVYEVPESPVYPATTFTVPELSPIHGQHSTANEHFSLIHISTIPALPAAPVTPSAPVLVYEVPEAPVTPAVAVTATPTPTTVTSTPTTATTTPTTATVVSEIPSDSEVVVSSSPVENPAPESPAVPTSGTPTLGSHPVVSHIINFANSILPPGSGSKTPAATATSDFLTPTIGLVNHLQNVATSAIAAVSAPGTASAEIPNRSGYIYKKPVKEFVIPASFGLISHAQNAASSSSSSSSSVQVNHQFLLPGIIQTIDQVKPCGPGFSSQSVSENSDKTSSGSFNQVTLINPGFLGIHTVPQSIFAVSN